MKRFCAQSHYAYSERSRREVSAMTRTSFWKNEMFGLQWLFACLCYATAPRETSSFHKDSVRDNSDRRYRTYRADFVENDHSCNGSASLFRSGNSRWR
jgi:hypothetical protein